MDFTIWFLLGAALVFFMQCGFAMVESGFTRAKNAANIIMKNLMDFCFGALCFVVLGFSIMMAEDYLFGFIGVPNLGIFTDYAAFDMKSFVFNLVFCATASTIVSGAMAERTKFSSYLIYCIVISLVVYPIEAGWIWNGNGWLAQMGFIDFAGGAAIHAVGGLSALIGAAFLGARIGKYTKDKDGKVVKVNAIPGHSLVTGALGCFILWFGWYGFNGAAATDVNQLASIFLVTTLAPAFATIATMAYTWIKNGKPDVSMSLNGSLAGLVAITPACNNVDALGSIIIGLVAGILVVVAIEFVDLKLHVDDPVGAVGVHFANGVWGILAVGLFAKPMTIGDWSVDAAGLFYGGGFKLLGVQALGLLAVIAWTTVMMVITFGAIKKFRGLRASREEELLGLDTTEHGIDNAYADFLPIAHPEIDVLEGKKKSKTPIIPVSIEKAVEITNTATGDPNTLTKVTIITRQSMFEPLKQVFDQIGITGITVTNVLGYGSQHGGQKYRGVEIDSQLLPKIQIDVVISKVPLDLMIDAVKRTLYTGNIGDGKVFIYDVKNVIKIRTGEEGYDALQDAAIGDE
jgi:Amt family ammonium transporter